MSELQVSMQWLISLQVTSIHPVALWILTATIICLPRLWQTLPLLLMKAIQKNWFLKKQKATWYIRKVSTLDTNIMRHVMKTRLWEPEMQEAMYTVMMWHSHSVMD